MAEGTRRRIRVLVVDDHDLFRAGLSALLSAEPDLEVVGQAAGGRAGIRLATELRPDVVLMDFSMPDLSGPDATRAILERDPAARVLTLTVLTDDSAVASALAAGSCGFIVKDTPIESVIAAVRAAAQGAAWLSPRAAELVLERMRRPPAGADAEVRVDEELSARELDVLRLVARGMENKEIAETLGISQRTAKNHVSNILAKLGMPSRVQAAVYAVRHGIA